jgi:hypothetical protein
MPLPWESAAHVPNLMRSRIRGWSRRRPASWLHSSDLQRPEHLVQLATSSAAASRAALLRRRYLSSCSKIPQEIMDIW